MTTIPPTHNYESQVVFSNQQNNIKSNDVKRGLRGKDTS